MKVIAKDSINHPLLPSLSKEGKPLLGVCYLPVIRLSLNSDMKLRRLRIPALALAMVLFSMTTCELLQAESKSDHAPPCHGKSVPDPAPKPEQHSGMKHCCEAGVIPNTHKSPVFTVFDNALLYKVELNQISVCAVPASLDLFPMFYPPGPTKISLLSILRI